MEQVAGMACCQHLVLTYDDGLLVTPPGATMGTTPLPAALLLFTSVLGAMGLLGWRRKRNAAAEAACA